MESLAPLIPQGRLYKRALQRAFRARWFQSHQPWDALIPLSPWFRQAVAHWLDLSWVSQGVPISVPPPQEELFTDASTRGWGAHMGPLSAAGLNHKLPTFVSPVPDPAVWAMDALSVPWAGLLAYAFPLLPILSKVLKKAREEQATLILIAPRWPAQPWFPELLCLSHVPPLKLYLHPRALLQPRSGIAHASPGLLDLHAWLLCGTRCLH